MPEEANDCSQHHGPIDGIRAAFVYEGAARKLVHGLKYRGLTALAVPMGHLMADRLQEYDLGVEVVVPVPLTGFRARTRGHNQASALAGPLARRLDLRYVPRGLERRGSAAPQARSANAHERRQNVAGAFLVRDGQAVSGRSVLLVDDVTTTGATFGSCAESLLAAGATAVWGFAFARED